MKSDDKKYWDRPISAMRLCCKSQLRLMRVVQQDYKEEMEDWKPDSMDRRDGNEWLGPAFDQSTREEGGIWRE